MISLFDFEHYFDTHPDKGWMYNQKPYFNVSVPLDPEERMAGIQCGCNILPSQKRHIYLLKDYEYVDFNGQLISVSRTVADMFVPRPVDATEVHHKMETSAITASRI